MIQSFRRQCHSNSPMGLNPSSQIHPILTDFVDDCIVALLCDLFLLSTTSNAEARSSDILNQFSSTSTGDSWNSKELFGEPADSPNTSSPLKNDVSVVRNGRNVTGSRCWSSNVYRVHCGEEVVVRDSSLWGEEDDDGVVVWAGGVILPSFVPSLDNGRRITFGLISSVNRRVIEDFFVEEDRMMKAKVQEKIGFDDRKVTARIWNGSRRKRGCECKSGWGPFTYQARGQKKSQTSANHRPRSHSGFKIHPFWKMSSSLRQELNESGFVIV